MMNRKSFLFLLSPAIAGLFVLSCTTKTQQLSAKPVLVVEEKTMTTKEFANHLARKMKHFDALAAKDTNNVQRAKEEVVRSFIIKSISEVWAKKNNISIDQQELEKEINRFRSNYKDDLSFRKVLAQENISFNEWKDEVHQTLLEKKIFQELNKKVIKPTELELINYFEENKERYKLKESIYLRQIVIEDEAKADIVKASLKNEGFEQSAQKYSIAPEAKQGGLVGWVEKGTLVVFDKAFSQSVGTIGPVIQSEYGYHIFKVEQKQPAKTMAYESVKKQILQEVLAKREQAEFTGWLDKNLRQIKVLRDNGLINSITVETRSE